MGVQTYREGRSQQGHCPSKRPWASEKKKKKVRIQFFDTRPLVPAKSHGISQ